MMSCRLPSLVTLPEPELADGMAVKQSLMVWSTEYAHIVQVRGTGPSTHLCGPFPDRHGGRVEAGCSCAVACSHAGGASSQDDGECLHAAWPDQVCGQRAHQTVAEELARREAAAEEAAAQLLQEEAAAGAAKSRAQAKKARQKQRKQARLLRLDLSPCWGLRAG